MKVTPVVFGRGKVSKPGAFTAVTISGARSGVKGRLGASATALDTLAKVSVPASVSLLAPLE